MNGQGIIRILDLIGQYVIQLENELNQLKQKKAEPD